VYESALKHSGIDKTGDDQYEENHPPMRG